MIVAVGAEILFQDHINPFSLAIGLGVKASGKLLLHSKELAWEPRELGGELGAVVSNNRLWKAIKVEDIVKEKFG